MNDIWSILKVAPTKDISAIKRAYAQQTRLCHPEEDPEGFMKLRQAYQAALAYAEDEDAAEAAGSPSRTTAEEMPAPESAAETGEKSEEKNDWLRRQRDPEQEAPAGTEEENIGWHLRPEEPDTGPNPYEDHEAIQQFLALYTGNRRRDPKAWMDYFTSDAFLDAAWDRRFTSLLLKHVNRLEEDFPPTREFLTWLSVAYQYTAAKVMAHDPYGADQEQTQFQLYEGTGFDGIEFIFQIAAKGPIPKRPKGNELAILNSFIEYQRLVRLAQEDIWNDPAIMAYSNILDRYVMAYLKDKCGQRNDSDYERHPAGLRIIVHFFTKWPLPEELYRILWKTLDLKNAVMGRSKLLYGSLRELVMEKVAGIASEAEDNFLALNQAYSDLCTVVCRNDHGQSCQALDAFFAREDLQRALKNHRFAEMNLLNIWTADWVRVPILEKILSYYTANPYLPYAQQIILRTKHSLAAQESRQRTEEDKNAAAGEETLSLRNRSFFRHWLNTGFYFAQNPETGQPLARYLKQNLPYLPEWSRRFLDIQDNVLPLCRCVSCALDSMVIEVRFHLRYMDFLQNGALIGRPCLEWEQLSVLEDSDTFFFLLPITAAAYDQYTEIRAELLRRLSATAAPENDREIIAGCLAGYVCRLPVPKNGEKPDYSILPFELFMEDAEYLYGCSWFQKDQVLLFYEQTPQGRRALPDGKYTQICDPETAIGLAQQLLEEAVSPSGIQVSLLSNLPGAVYAEPDSAVIYSDPARTGADMPRMLIGEEITLKQLDTLFTLLADKRIKRLELSWPADREKDDSAAWSLVFLKEPAGWACLYFDDIHNQSYALIGQPKLYWQEDNSASPLIPFRQSKLFTHNIHRNFATIRKQLDLVLRQANNPGSIQLHAGGIWSYAVSISHGRHKYILDKRLLGGFPAQRAHNQLSAPFYLYSYPDSIAYTDGQGQFEALQIGSPNRYRIRDILARTMQGGLTRLRMTWGNEPGRQRHIIVLHEQGRYMMAWLMDETQKAEFHVADVHAYMNAEGKKYPKDTFRGRSVPSYLVHHDVIFLRSALEDLLANIYDSALVTEQFAEYAPENPVKPRPYEVIRAELTEEG